MPPDPPSDPASRASGYRALAVTVVTLAVAYGVWYAYSVFLVALLKEFGWSRSVLAGAFSLFTLVSGGAGPVLGALADRFGPRRLILAGGALLAASLWADSYVTRAWHLSFIVPAMMSDRFRGPHFGSIFGATQVASALGSALGAWLAGRLFDATGSYAIAFGLAAGAAAVAALSVWASRIPRATPG